jgi:hypothetical protein
MKERIEAKRLSYRYDGDLDSLLAVAMPAVGHVLHFAAQYLGHCSTTDGPIVDGHADLVAALQRAGLAHWLLDFGRDLQRFSQRLGQWESFDEFLAFNRHVERLLWAVGMFPWEGPEGNHVEIPLISDAAALMAETQSTS